MKHAETDGLEVRNIKKLYPEFMLDVSFRVNPGEFVTLVGPSGCGKTTTLSLIAGLLEADEGAVLLNGTDQQSVPVWKRSIGIVFQDYALFPNMNISKNIGYGLRARKIDKRIIHKRTRELLKLVNLSNYFDRSVSELSGGEKQRIALARALAPEPELLLLDEPLSALDAQLRKSLRKEIRAIQKKLLVTTLYVTHDQEEALSLSDRIIIMNNGRIEQIGTPQDVYTTPASKFAAEFFGRATLLPVEAVSQDDQSCKVNLPDSNLQNHFFCRPWIRKQPMLSASPDLQRGLLFFRPEDTAIIDAESIMGETTPGYNTFHGAKVIDYEYSGSGYYIDALWHDCRLSVFSRSYLSEGSTIAILVPANACCFIPENHE
jgi:ABC-type Fe3+/spermidine/putrescine transport system ATPase subunit